jgi:hypothetical protein
MTETLTVGIGVTGHRRLKAPERIARSVREVLAQLDALLDGRAHRYRVLSSLAEGADRLVAGAVLDWQGVAPDALVARSELFVALPMPEASYLLTFDRASREASVREFTALRQRAAEVVQVADAPDRHEAYERAGRFVGDRCDVLVAVWDGKPAHGRGGTAEIVAYARARGRAVVRIDSRTGRIRWPPRGEDFVSQLAFARTYRRETAHRPALEAEAQKRSERLRDQAREAGLELAELPALQGALLPALAKAALLARHYQSLYFRSGTAAYCLAALAVALAALGALIMPGAHWLFLVEAAVIVATVVLAWPPRFHSLQRKWIDYRFLAERLRAGQFGYLAVLAPELAAEPTPADLPVVWTTMVLDEVWQSLPPREAATLPEANGHLGALTRFLFRAWIDHQARYYRDAGERNHRRHEWLEGWLRVNLALTLIVAIAHFALGGQAPEEAARTALDAWLTVCAVTFPAIAGALAGISAFRHFHFNAQQYTGMSHYLQALGTQMLELAAEPRRAQGAGGLVRLHLLLRDAARAMAREHHGWTLAVGAQLPGPG